MRGARSYWITGGYTLLVAAVVLVVYHFAGFGSAVNANTRAADIVIRAVEVIVSSTRVATKETISVTREETINIAQAGAAVGYY